MTVVIPLISTLAKPHIENHTINRENIGQDFSTCGTGKDINGNFHYMIVADGHGKGNYIKILSSEHFSWDSVVAETSSKNMYSKIHTQVQHIVNEIKDFAFVTDFTNDGSTLSIVKIYKKMIKCYWVGDSQIRIYKNNDTIFKSSNHNGRNKKELTRLMETYDKSHKVEIIPSLSIVDSNTLTMKKHPQIHFFINAICEKMMLTRSLGHNEKLFPSFQTKTIMLDNEKGVRIIVASDGFWDMYCENEHSTTNDKSFLLSSDAKSLAQQAFERWNQTWNIKKSTKTKQLSQSSIDDVSIALFTY